MPRDRKLTPTYFHHRLSWADASSDLIRVSVHSVLAESSRPWTGTHAGPFCFAYSRFVVSSMK